MKLLILTILLIVLCVSLITAPVYAEHTIVFINGDILRGILRAEDPRTVVFETDFLGTLTIEKEKIATLTQIDEPLPPKEIVVWKRSLATGYNITSGNTAISNFNFVTNINRKAYRNETTFKARYAQSASDSKMDSQKWNTLGRFAYSFGTDREWFNFYKTTIEHNKFSNIDYRFIPSSGIGYWFEDEPPLKALAELGLGWEYTKYNNNTASREDIALIPRGLVEWNVVGNALLSEEMILFSSLVDLEHYRFTSITTFSNPISKNISAQVQFTNDYNSNPANNAQNNDLTLTSSLVYSF